MLVEFSFSNFRSFRNSSTLSMLPTKLTSEKNFSDVDVINVNECATSGIKTLRVAAIYGSNGSGKSNVVKALEFMKRFVINSSRMGQSGDKIPIEPFLLDTSGKTEPSGFEVVFVTKGTKYRYGFEVDRENVISEWLYYVPRIRETVIFDRVSADIKINSKFEKSFKTIFGLTRSNALFVSVLAQFNTALAEDVLAWFKDVNFVEPDMSNTSLNPERNVLERVELRDALTNLLSIFDIGIERLDYEKKNWDKEPIFKSFPKSVQEFIVESPIKPNLIKSVHSVYNDDGDVVGEVAFDLDKQESDGTRKLISILPTIMSALARGEIAVIDEMDARLHPRITATIIKIFQTHKHKSCAQLIITTHDTNILTKENFRRDQIWFVEKNKRGVSELFSLAEIQSRNDANYEDDYLNGRYGAIPYINKSKLMEI